MAAAGIDVKRIWRKIEDIIIKTLITVQAELQHSYRMVQPLDLSNALFFHILGFDVLLDHRYKPWLLEVNQSPSFTADTSLDYKVKFGVI
jgi:tubulin polyglutamylase TTLL6/13